MTPDPVSAAVWNWRRTDVAGGRAKEARRARREGVLRGSVGLAAALVIWLVWKSPAAFVVATIALVLVAIALASPLGWHPRLNSLMGRFARGVGSLFTWLLMPLLYVAIFFPVGLFLRLRGRLRLTLGPEPVRETYWVRRKPDPGSAESYQRQF